VGNSDDVKQCLVAIEAVLKVCGVDMNCPHSELVQSMHIQLGKLKQSLEENPHQTRQIRKNITKISMSPCTCGHPLWAHQTGAGCQQIVFNEESLQLESCSCDKYEAVGSFKTKKQIDIEATLSVPCPKCSAIKGEACRMKDGEHYPNASYFHAARKRAATQPAGTL
jgi:hypothetical protein